MHICWRLFGRVLIPPAVWAELLAFHHDLPDWLEVVTVTDSSRVTEYRRHVHAGEAEAIALAVEIKPDWLLIDDADGRKLAKSEGAPVVGLMGCCSWRSATGLFQKSGLLWTAWRLTQVFICPR